MKSNLLFIHILIFSPLLCWICSGAVTYHEQSVSETSAIILKTKLVQTQENDLVLATFSSQIPDNTYQLSLVFLSHKDQSPIIVNSDTNCFAWDIRPSTGDSETSSVDVFFSTPSNSSWYIYKYAADGTSELISEETDLSFDPNSFLAYQPSDDDYGCYVVANSKRELYMSSSRSLTKIGDFVSISFASFAVGEVDQASPPLFFIGVSAMQPRSAIWYVDPASEAGAVPQRIDASEGILSIETISLDAAGSILVHEKLNGFTKVYRWQRSDPANTFHEFQIQGTFTLLPFMSSPEGRFLVYNTDPIFAFGKVKLTQWVNWDGKDPSETSGYVVQDSSSISGLASMTSSASCYLTTQDLSVIIAYPSGGKVRVTELKFQDSTKKPENIGISGFQVPQGLGSKRLLTSEDDGNEMMSKVSKRKLTQGRLRAGREAI